jgi:hypothetical protein
MANVQITQLPQAGAITGTEAVPIVQNGQTVQTTTAAIAGSPVQTQTFLTLNQEPTLPNSRALSGGTGVGLVDGGAQSTLQITLNGASGSLEAAGNGLIAKTGSSSVTARSIAVSGSGLSITNGDGISGNPTLAMTGLPSSLAGLTGSGFLCLPNNGTVNAVTLTGTSDQITVTGGDGTGGNPTFAIASNPVLPGTGGVNLPAGATGDRPAVPINGVLRYNTDTGLLEAYLNGSWSSLASGSGVTSILTGTGLTGGPITSTGTISIANTAVTAGSYTAANITVNAQGQITAASSNSALVASFSAGTTGFTPNTATTGAVTLAGTLNPANGGTGQTSYTDGQLLIGNSTGNTLTKSTLTAGSGITITNGSGSITIAASGASGTVTSVSQTFTGGLISVSGSPITTSGTLALTVAGTSGGIPYFDSASSWATSAALGSNQIMVGGGAGAAPSTITTGTGVVTALGVNTGSSGAFVVNGGALGTPSSGTVTNLTGTASININGTVGATTPTTGAFTTVSASGVITSTVATGTAPFTVASTTQVANLNAATAGAATNTAITANSTNATNYLTFVSATAGNLGQLVNSSITCNPSTGAITGGISGGTF